MLNQPNKNLRAHPKILLLLFLIVSALGSLRTAAFAFQSSPTAEERKLQVASMQYDMIFLLIQNKNFDQVEAEWRKVLDQKLGAKYEKQVADSLLDILYKLSEAKQFPLAQKILDQSLAAVSFSNRSKADILRFKALLYKDSGDLDNAIKTMQQALELATEK